MSRKMDETEEKNEEKKKHEKSYRGKAENVFPKLEAYLVIEI